MCISVPKLGLDFGAFLGGFAINRIGLIATLASAGCVCLGTAVMVWLFGRDAKEEIYEHVTVTSRASVVED